MRERILAKALHASNCYAQYIYDYGKRRKDNTFDVNLHKGVRDRKLILLFTAASARAPHWPDAKLVQVAISATGNLMILLSET